MSAGKGIAGYPDRRGGEREAPPAPATIIVTREIVYHGAQVSVVKRDDGGRQLRIIDPGAATVHVIDLDPEAARQLGGELRTSIPIAGADEMPGAKS